MLKMSKNLFIAYWFYIKAKLLWNDYWLKHK